MRTARMSAATEAPPAEAETAARAGRTDAAAARMAEIVAWIVKGRKAEQEQTSHTSVRETAAQQLASDRRHTTLLQAIVDLAPHIQPTPPSTLETEAGSEVGWHAPAHMEAARRSPGRRLHQSLGRRHTVAAAGSMGPCNHAFCSPLARRGQHHRSQLAWEIHALMPFGPDRLQHFPNSPCESQWGIRLLQA